MSTHRAQLHHLLALINSDSLCYIESKVSTNEIFKHLKSLKTNLLNVLAFLIKSSICNYIRPVITAFRDLHGTVQSVFVRLFHVLIEVIRNDSSVLLGRWLETRE